MKAVTTVIAIAVTLAVSISAFGGIAAAKGPSYTTLTLNSESVYDSLRNQVAGKHNSFASKHKACKSEVSQKWDKTAHSDMGQVKGILKQMARFNTKQKKKQVYKDLVKVDKLLKTWAKKDIIKLLGTCKKMPRDNQGIDNGFNKVDNDLGITGGYG
ncbi:MAG TPA: hypothetical protein VFB34_09615 [Chloroflexota bacterium]|nr:hypothetical protein [Chloroflexota bacterium]